MDYESRFAAAIDAIFGNSRAGTATMVVAPTATGKSVTIPKLIYARLSEPNARVVVCIPTRIAAISVAAKAQQLYPEIKIEHRYGAYSPSSDANIVYTTPTQLLLEYVHSLEYGKQGDSFPWDAVVIDEVHMRTTIMSLILSFHRIMVDNRRQSAKKIVTVLMTATPVVELGLFEFVGFPVSVQSTSSVTTVYLEREVANSDLNNGTATLVLSLVEINNPYSILVFVKGIGAAKDIEMQILKENPQAVEIFLLNGKIPLNEFYKIMQPPAKKYNKILKTYEYVKRVILSTNVAESSITIPYVGYVVDTLLERRPSVGDTFATNALEDTPITHTSSEQRKGRVGRSSETKGVAFYHPMMTRDQYQEYYLSGNHPESRVRVPDIQLAPPIKICVFLIDRLFSPRNVLLEVENLSDYLLEMMERNIIQITYTSNCPLDGDETTEELMNRYVAQFAESELEESESYASASEELSLGSEEESCTERLEEHISLTEIGKFWMQNHRLDYMAMLFIYNWSFVKKYDPIVGCLIAVIVNEEHEGIFSEIRRDQTRESWIEYHKEAYARYLGVDPLSTLLYLFYDLFRFLPRTASLSFEASNIRSWCNARRIGFEPLYNILLEWKVLCSTVAQKSNRSMAQYMSIPEAIQKTIECCDPQQRLRLYLGSRYSNESMKDVKLHYGGVPYLDAPLKHNSYPQTVCYLKLRSTRLLNSDQRRSVNFYVLGNYDRILYNNPLAAIPVVAVTELDLEDEDRYRRVEPHEIGLVRGLFALPSWVKKEDTKESERSLVLPSCIFPFFLGPERNTRTRQKPKYEAEIEYVFADDEEEEDRPSTAVELNMLISQRATSEQLDDYETVSGHFRPKIY